MVARVRPLLVAAAMLSLVVAARTPAVAQEPVVLARSMLEVLAPLTNDVAGALIDSLDANGEPDPADLSDNDWIGIDAALMRLSAETATLRDRPIRVVANSGDTIFGEEASGLSAADVQEMIDANRAEFNYYVDVMLADFAQMRDAVARRDAAALWEVAGVLDVKCNACHERFWYPNWQEDASPPP